MRRRTAGKVAKPRMCAFCQGPISEKRPVFLVATTAGTIIGPYHAGCAERIALEQKGPGVHIDPPAAEYGKIIPAAREETLPW